MIHSHFIGLIFSQGGKTGLKGGEMCFDSFFFVCLFIVFLIYILFFPLQISYHLPASPILLSTVIGLVLEVSKETTDEVQDKLPLNMPFWHIDNFELKLLNK